MDKQKKSCSSSLLLSKRESKSQKQFEQVNIIIEMLVSFVVLLTCIFWSIMNVYND